MTEERHKRFWIRAQTTVLSGGFAVQLDGRPLRPPDGTELRCVNRDLADAVAEEWNQAAGGEQGSVFHADEFMLTGLAGALQRQAETASLVDRMIGFVDSDLLCYRATYPEALATQQAAQWQPWLDWLRDRFGIEMLLTSGIMPIRQSKQASEGLRPVLAQCSPATLIALGVLVPALGSVVLGLAVAFRRLEAAEALHLARLDERFQASRWGEDAETTLRVARLRSELEAAVRFTELVDG